MTISLLGFTQNIEEGNNVNAHSHISLSCCRHMEILEHLIESLTNFIYRIIESSFLFCLHIDYIE